MNVLLPYTFLSIYILVFSFYEWDVKYTSTLPRYTETLLWICISGCTINTLPTHHFVILNVSNKSIKYSIVVMLMYQNILFDFFQSYLSGLLTCLFRKPIAGCMSWCILLLKNNSYETQWWNAKAWHFLNFLQYYNT